jgi:hypothetical protein
MIEGRKCVKRDGLAAAYWGTSQRRDPRAVQASVQTLDEDPPRPMAQLMAGLAAPAPQWERVAELANAGLDCSAWGPPPWPADRWATLAMVLSLAEEAAAE